MDSLPGRDRTTTHIDLTFIRVYNKVSRNEGEASKVSEWNTMAFFEKATLKIVQKMIDSGADANAKDEWGFTPLHFAAAFNDDPDIISALVDAGAQINARDKEWAPPRCIGRPGPTTIPASSLRWWTGGLIRMPATPGRAPRCMRPPTRATIPTSY